MAFQAQFIRFRSEDNHPTPVGLPAQVVALTADEAMQKLRRLVADCPRRLFSPAARAKCSRYGRHRRRVGIIRMAARSTRTDIHDQASHPDGP